MKVRRGYKVELDLNNAQRTLCLKHAGCSRFSWNWGLARKQEAYQQTGKMPTAIDLHKQLNALKKTDYPWLYECSKCAPQEALRDLDIAYRNAYRRLGEKKAGKYRGKVGWRLWHAFGESSSVREKKSFGQSSQREGCSSNMASSERTLELMGLKSQEEVGSGSNIAPPLKGAKAHTASLCATRSPSGHEV